MTDLQALRPPSPQVKRRRWAVLVVILVVLAGFVTAGVVAVTSFFGSPDDFAGAGTGEVEVVVPVGASAARIGGILEEGGVVASAGAFTDAAAADPRSRGIAPGTYAMAQQMSAQAALERLLDPASRVQARVVVREGVNLEDIITEITSATEITEADVRAAIADPASLGLPDYARDTVEGFLYPATYDVDPGDTATDLLSAMAERFTVAAIDIDLVDRAAAAGVDPFDVVVAASLVEAEVAPVDFGKAARVIANRLEAGMRLQFDSTVNYALDRSQLDVSLQDLEVDSPYNTYRIAGLPPAPIGSPSSAAMEAVLEPEPGDWVYFVSTDPAAGITKFTSSYQEFLQFKAEFQANTR